LEEAAGFRSGGGLSRRWYVLGALLLGGLLLAWFLSQHLTITSGGRSTTSATTPTLPAAPGYSRTEAGAVDAATSYLTTIDGPMLLEPDQLAAFERQVGSGNYAEQLVKDSQEGAAQLESTYGLHAARERGLKVALQPEPLAYKLASPWNGWSASISVWWIQLVAIDGVTPTMALWQTTTLGLVWENGNWHISNAQSEAGPGSNADSTALPEQLTGFERYRHVV
jgi:hypothetical protein